MSTEDIPRHLRGPEYAGAFVLARMAGHNYANCWNCRFNRPSYDSKYYCKARDTDPHPQQLSKTNTLCPLYQPARTG